MSDHIQNVTDADFEAVVLRSAGTCIIDFWAPWCGPCRMQGPILERFAASHPDVKIVKVNVDESPAVAEAFGIRSIPTIAIVLDGKPTLGAVGVQNERALDQLIEEAKQRKLEE
jgi:thioredoxin 1